MPFLIQNHARSVKSKKIKEPMKKQYLLGLGLLAMLSQQLSIQPASPENPVIPYYNAKVAYHFATKEAPFFGANQIQKNRIAQAKKTIKDLHYPIYTLRGEELKQAQTIIQSIMNSLSKQIKGILKLYNENKYNLKIQKQTQGFFTRIKNKFRTTSAQEKLNQTEKESLKTQITRAQEEYKIARRILDKLELINAKYQNYLSKQKSHTKGHAMLNQTLKKEYEFFKANHFWPQPRTVNSAPTAATPNQNPIKTLFNQN